ncbi:MAG TPA: alkaline phosphatase family protein [Candidatus Bathyarchaeia archaeon]|nr:alkaline phosphatase family protein [Candidatus Bathyarchaeia archaeon]
MSLNTGNCGQGNVLGMILLTCIVLAAAVGTNMPTVPIGAQNLHNTLPTPSGIAFDYVVVIIMENHSLCSIVGNITIGCAASNIAPYEAGLAQTSSLATDYTALTHPSVPNYLALVSGSTFGVTSDCLPTTKPCNSNPVCCPVAALNIVDRLDRAGLTWKGYAEDYPVASGCSNATNRLPFNYFADIYSNVTRCARLVNANSLKAGSSIGNPDLFLNDLASSKTFSNFMWFAPSGCDQGHGSCASATDQGDVYLSTVVPRILNSAIFTTQRAALFIVEDEGTGGDTCPVGSGDCVYALWAGPQVKRGYQCNTAYSHYSFLATLEWNWGLASLTSNDGSAHPMTELFKGGPPCKLQGSFMYSSSYLQAGQVSEFSALVSGGVQPYSFVWNFGDGSTEVGRIISHAYQSGGSFSATLTVTDGSGRTVTVSRVLTVAPLQSSTRPPPPSGLCIECLIKALQARAPIVVGLPIGLVLVFAAAAFAKRRQRKMAVGPNAGSGDSLG